MAFSLNKWAYYPSFSKLSLISENPEYLIPVLASTTEMTSAFNALMTTRASLCYLRALTKAMEAAHLYSYKVALFLIISALLATIHLRLALVTDNSFERYLTLSVSY